MSRLAFALSSSSSSPLSPTPLHPQSPPRRPRTNYLCSLPQNLPEPTFIPQTIEFAIRRAQAATAEALSLGISHVRIELPMGRSRKHWYRMSPINSWYTETSVLAFHFCEMFKGLAITLVLGTGPGVSHSVNWLEGVCRAEDLHAHSFSNASDHVVVIAGISQCQRSTISEVLIAAPGAKAYVLFNCLLDVPLCQNLEPFRTAYACRALDKCATLKESFRGAWTAFVEIAVFEYEWIGISKDGPTQRGIEAVATKRGAKKKGGSGYYVSEFAGCEAGFWPFMTVCCRQVLPMDGAAMARVSKEKAEKKARKSSRPFGFF